jgi:hypothetical protein
MRCLKIKEYFSKVKTKHSIKTKMKLRIIGKVEMSIIIATVVMIDPIYSCFTKQ